jgi:bifunctional non-homologous end joining protein LigD
MAPTLAKFPPVGPEWVHEVKFDGWRAQLHIDGDTFTLYTKNGADYSKRLNQIAYIARSIPAKTAILDCELVACDHTGLPCFRTLMELGNKATLCLIAFDLLHIEGVRLMPIPIEDRKAILKTLVAKAGSPYLQFADGFEDPAELLNACGRMDFEGIVSKRIGSPYRSGPTRDWVKIKTASWRAANAKRFELLKKRA